MFVEIVDYPENQQDLALLVTATEKSIIAAVYARGDGDLQGVIGAQTALPFIAQGNSPKAIENHGRLFINQSIVVHDLRGMMGFDELVDYSVLDLYADSLAWEPRLAQTRQTKILYSARVRELQRRRLLASLYVRFSTGDFSETVLHLVNQGGSLVTDLSVDHRFDGTTVPVGPGGAKWLDYFWYAEVRESSRKDDGAIVFDVSLKNNRDDRACERATRLEVSTDAGYLPRRFITTDEQGRAQFVLIPTGLVAGERVKVKLSATHFTNIGSASVEV